MPSKLTDDLSDDDIEWMMQEFALTAERARDRGLTPAEFLLLLNRYGTQMMADFTTAVEAAGGTDE